MKLGIILASLSLTSAVQACSVYQHCHCYNSDGVPNDTATAAVCKEFGELRDKTDGDRTYKECYFYKFNFFGSQGIGNCQMRKSCQIRGATGDDSSCRKKITIW
ncbi:hypothetical protein CTRI78_v002579 [Colletotrichum trifolii]|uniref:Secreted protein n=1 Tax=Colletotrichum trifolii TaxID=5466 RepID=A0A4R8RRF5_COLTR|nr:hypothetical protein CTRI78_v002579 [Colletotrichum trifolii]